MAVPTPPTLSSLASEALARAGYSSPSTALTARATGLWIEEIKDDVWAKAKKLKSLQTKYIQTLTKGLGQYNNPTDFASELAMEFATGTRYGAAQAGSTTSVTLASTETAAAADLIGKQLAITAGLGSAQIAFITAYDSATKIATLSPTLTVAPDVTSTYVILDFYLDVKGPKPIFKLGELNSPTTQGYPEAFYSEGNSADGQFTLFPIPYRTDSQPMILIERYYADLTELDVSGALMLVLYQKWRNLWMTGLTAKGLDDADDANAPAAFTKYKQALQALVSAEQYGNTLSVAQAQVEDYG